MHKNHKNIRKLNKVLNYSVKINSALEKVFESLTQVTMARYCNNSAANFTN